MVPRLLSNVSCSNSILPAACLPCLILFAQLIVPYQPEEYYALDRSYDPYEMARSNEIIKMLIAWKDKETSEVLDKFFVQTIDTYIAINIEESVLRNLNHPKGIDMSCSIEE